LATRWNNYAIELTVDYNSCGNTKLERIIAIFNLNAATDCVNFDTEYRQVEENECFAARNERDYTNLPLLEVPAPLCVIVDWGYMNTTPDDPPGPTRALMDTVINELVDVGSIIGLVLQKSRGLQAARSEFEFDETNSTPQYAVFNLPVKQNIISANRPD
jgi:hypothetical protein